MLQLKFLLFYNIRHFTYVYIYTRNFYSIFTIGKWEYPYEYYRRDKPDIYENTFTIVDY